MQVLLIVLDGVLANDRAIDEVARISMLCRYDARAL